MRVLIAPDKFKGSLTAREAAHSIAAGWSSARPHDTVELLPISDGGDGFGPVMADFWNASPRRIHTVDAASRPRESLWWWVSSRRKAIIETATVIGLALLPPKAFHPFQLDTRGLASLLLQVRDAGAESTLIGIGGSATNDGGFGLAQALGWRFLNVASVPILRWPDLDQLHAIEPPGSNRFPDLDWTVAVDVRNPLLGPQGASRIYGPQKGLQEADMPQAEAALHQLAEVAHRCLGRDHSSVPGAGAAGGLGFGLATFLGAHLKPGFQLVASEAQLADRVRSVDLVIAAEGMIDPSSAMGKGAGELARLCAQLGTPCIGLAGRIAPEFHPLLTRSGFRSVHAICPDLATPEKSLAEPALWLQQLARVTALSEPFLAQVDRR